MTLIVCPPGQLVLPTCQHCSDPNAHIPFQPLWKPFSNPMSVTQDAYSGAVYHPNTNRVYFANKWSFLTQWHYIDVATGTVHGYPGPPPGELITDDSYIDAVHCPSNGRVYFTPRGQLRAPRWHYINPEGVMVSYSPTG